MYVAHNLCWMIRLLMLVSLFLDESMDSDCGEPAGCTIMVNAECNVITHTWRDSTHDVTSNADDELHNPAECYG